MVAPNASKFNEQVDPQPPQQVCIFTQPFKLEFLNILHVSELTYKFLKPIVAVPFGKPSCFDRAQSSFTSPAPAVATYIS